MTSDAGMRSQGESAARGRAQPPTGTCCQEEPPPSRHLLISGRHEHVAHAITFYRARFGGRPLAAFPEPFPEPFHATLRGNAGIADVRRARHVACGAVPERGEPGGSRARESAAGRVSIDS
jgi:hypothetical protein